MHSLVIDIELADYLFPPGELAWRPAVPWTVMPDDNNLSVRATRAQGRQGSHEGVKSPKRLEVTGYVADDLIVCPKHSPIREPQARARIRSNAIGVDAIEYDRNSVVKGRGVYRFLP